MSFFPFDCSIEYKYTVLLYNNDDELTGSLFGDNLVYLTESVGKLQKLADGPQSYIIFETITQRSSDHIYH